MTFPLLSAVIFLPVIGALLLMLMKREEVGAIRAAALTTSLVTFVVSLALFFGFQSGAGAPAFQFVERVAWLPQIGAQYALGVDGMSLVLVVLTTFLVPISILASWTAIEKRQKEFYAALLLLEAGVVGVFAASDLLLFYVFWEVMLLPMFLLIAIWGGERRAYASVKFFVYTMVGSLLMLAAVLYVYFKAGGTTFDMATLKAKLALSYREEFWLFLGFAIAFVIKVPVFPFHTWLPDAHTEAPTAGSVILAAVLLKMGTYGLIRIAIPFFPHAAQETFMPVLAVLAVIGIIYGALMALAQEDMKKLIAYSSVSHLGFVVLGIAAWNENALSGAIYLMLGHGLTTGALFLFVGAIYERRHTRRIADYGGVAKSAPALAAVFMIAMLGSAGLPGLCGFVGEFPVLLGAFERSPLAGSIAASGVILGAVYLLSLYQRIMFGPQKSDADRNTHDLTVREYVYFVPMVLAIAALGLPGVTGMVMSPIAHAVNFILKAGA